MGILKNRTYKPYTTDGTYEKDNQLRNLGDDAVWHRGGAILEEVRERPGRRRCRRRWRGLAG